MKAFSLVILALTSVAQAGIDIPNEAARIEYIRNADVWGRPDWVNEDFSFRPDFKLSQVHEIKGLKDITLSQESILCENAAKEAGSGKTPKFECNLYGYDESRKLVLLKKENGKPETIKVKYNVPKKDLNGEIWGEVLASRVLKALGFGADKMYFTTVYCKGCSENPFPKNPIDKSTLQNPRVFSPGAIEDKPKGEEMEGEIEGFWPNELVKYVSADPVRARAQKIQRDALRLMMVFIQHADNKPENQRMLCKETTDTTGTVCTGKVLLYLQDVGATFGKGAYKKGPLNAISMPSKVDFEGWKATPIWLDASKCQGKLNAHHSGDKEAMDPVISEEGRVFLSKLFDGLTSGPEGRQRVLDLFKSVKIQEFSKATPEQWTEVFMSKVEQIKYPMGKQNSGFRCPTTIN